MKLFSLFAATFAVSSAWPLQKLWEQKWEVHFGDDESNLTQEEIEYRQMQREEFKHGIKFAEGFAYGFAVYDNLSETAVCMKEGFSVVSTLKEIKNQYRAAEITSTDALFQAYNALKSVPAQWHECFDAPTDLLKFSDWVVKITSLKMDDIWSALFTVKADWEQGMADLADGKYFQSGKDMAKIFVDLVGGPEPDALDSVENIAIGNKTEASAELIAGIIYGVTEKNDLEQIDTCLADADEFVSDILLGIHMLEKMDFVDLINGFSLLGATVAEIPNYLYQCAQIKPDLMEFEQWLTAFEHPKELAPVIEANIKRHLAALTLDLAKVKKTVSNGEWFHAGEELGIMLVIAVGPVEAEIAY
mmetsp:Transcript_38405/g.52130  ORF Transcript_38405/g.52130 Transcript_38405/m.52130 type:complete len:360 (-) Transcript_38405:104-1183(-)|eukprot:CAMPEP_0176365392 /NCGR_PEP_ID=MMETSP0126-20121128/20438_1 /TAXON_ID=141414 ORGANISM="Strombidinopsis acuminatum, Strain SPMC142" /NCGR_SAMPLE_ID=MMETSP0126 /ASSEMBLY_ACC=CAM_ASM_000229 /LENGTH=359 /DNA_ID=CAMNT_0017722375 /DNA_START=19 /DNA_END=1098 /DNA_ORIENTATION=-